MNEFDDENRILELIRDVPSQKVGFLSDDDSSKTVFESLIGCPEKWVDNSGKDAPPPDYLNPSDSIMMEVMRVNDTDSASSKRESELQEEIAKSGLLDSFPNVKNIICVPNIHSQSYSSYVKSFNHAIKKHDVKIEKYHSNHPGFKTIAFLVCDESEAYFETHGEAKGIIHTWFRDKAFMSTLLECRAQCVIWFTPYKALERFGINYPEIVVINPELIDSKDWVNYDAEFMSDASKALSILWSNT